MSPFRLLSWVLYKRHEAARLIKNAYHEGKRAIKEGWQKAKAKAKELWRRFREWLSKIIPPMMPRQGKADPNGSRQQAGGDPGAPDNTQPEEDESQQQEEPQEGDKETAQFLVQNQAGGALDTHFEFEDAVEQWKEETEKQGVIIDLETGEDVTPESLLDQLLYLLGLKDRNKRHLWLEDQVNEEMGRLDSASFQDLSQAASSTINPGLGINKANVMKLIQWLNNQRQMLPFLEASRNNIEEEPVTVEVPERTLRVRQVPTQVPSTKIVTTEDINEVLRPFPTGKRRTRPMRAATELRRASTRRHLALPRTLLARKIMMGEIDVVEHIEDEVTETHEIVPSTELEMVDEEYWHEEMVTKEITRLRGGQTIMILFDISPSMINRKHVYADRADIAAAAANLMIGDNLDNGSTYLYRAFAGRPGRLTRASTREEKIRLTQTVLNARAAIPAGTSITRVLRQGAADIRKFAQKGEQMEILLITDGEEPGMSALEIREILGSDVKLNTVMIHESNWDLRELSDTYVELHDHQFASDLLSIRS